MARTIPVKPTRPLPETSAWVYDDMADDWIISDKPVTPVEINLMEITRTIHGTDVEMTNSQFEKFENLIKTANLDDMVIKAKTLPNNNLLITVPMYFRDIVILLNNN